jgi:DNA topoisomerase-3
LASIQKRNWNPSIWGRGMRLIIAEKPSLGRAIASVIGVKSNHSGYILCFSDTVVTWCFGHLYELCEPESYNQEFKRWRLDDLPIIPVKWKKQGKASALNQIKIIRGLLSSSESVIHAGDAGREGQLLVDEVLESFGYKKKVERIWLSSLDDVSVRKALSSLRSNLDYRHLRDAAEARSRADWMVGINVTRAMTCLWRQKGYSGVVSGGRVQCPTLALVVSRDREIEKFKPFDYFVPAIFVGSEEDFFWAQWIPDMDNPDVDEQGRLLKLKLAENMVNGLKGQFGVVASYESRTRKIPPPRPYRLSTLQQEASARFGATAQKTLDTVQSLYEKKLVTYPRTDCDYLPEEQFHFAAKILSEFDFPGKNSINFDFKSPAWNTLKVKEHHAIIPTGEHANLDGEEADIFSLILSAYARQFMGDYCYESQKIVISLGGKRWGALGKKVIRNGWQIDGKESALPHFSVGGEVLCRDVRVRTEKTQAPMRFTEGTLIEAMTQIHKYVQDVRQRTLLKETSGIGTEATRAGIIETLKKRGYLATQSKTIVSTETGRLASDFFPDLLKNPATTALWEDELSKVNEGSLGLSDFLAREASVVKDVIAALKKQEISMVPKFSCALCGSALVRIYSSKKKSFFWACVDNFVHPKFSDNKGVPG